MESCKVSCPNCKKVFWETTDKFDPEITPNGSMLRLLQPYRKNHWPIFGDGIMPTRDGTGTVGTKCAEMDCLQCLAQLAPSGKLNVLAPRPEPEPTMQEALGVEDQIEMTVDKRYICEVCGREAKSPQGLRVHMAVHKRAGDTTKQEVREQERRSG